LFLRGFNVGRLFPRRRGGLSRDWLGRFVYQIHHRRPVFLGHTLSRCRGGTAHERHVLAHVRRLDDAAFAIDRSIEESLGGRGEFAVDHRAVGVVLCSQHGDGHRRRRDLGGAFDHTIGGDDSLVVGGHQNRPVGELAQ
jgi:hypothetical protein